jgi:hypothetical protein
MRERDLVGKTKPAITPSGIAGEFERLIIIIK